MITFNFMLSVCGWNGYQNSVSSIFGQAGLKIFEIVEHSPKKYCYHPVTRARSVFTAPTLPTVTMLAHVRTMLGMVGMGVNKLGHAVNMLGHIVTMLADVVTWGSHMISTLLRSCRLTQC